MRGWLADHHDFEHSAGVVHPKEVLTALEGLKGTSTAELQLFVWSWIFKALDARKVVRLEEMVASLGSSLRDAHKLLNKWKELSLGKKRGKSKWESGESYLKVHSSPLSYKYRTTGAD